MNHPLSPLEYIISTPRRDNKLVPDKGRATLDRTLGIPPTPNQFIKQNNRPVINWVFVVIVKGLGLSYIRLLMPASHPQHRRHNFE